MSSSRKVKTLSDSYDLGGVGARKISSSDNFEFAMTAKTSSTTLLENVLAK